MNTEATNRQNLNQINQMFVNSLKEDGAVCDFLSKEYDEQATYNGGEGIRRLFTTTNKQIKKLHVFLRALIGEDRVDIDEAIPVIDFLNPKNSSFLSTYPIDNGQIDQMTILDIGENSPYVINKALMGEKEAEYFFNTQSSISSQYNIQTSPVTQEDWVYCGVRQMVTVQNLEQPSSEITYKNPIYFYQHSSSIPTKFIFTPTDLYNNSTKETKIEFQAYHSNLKLYAPNNNGIYDKYVALLYDNPNIYGVSDHGQLPEEFSLPYCPTSTTSSALGSSSSGNFIIPINNNDIILLIPDYTTSLVATYKVFIFKYLNISGLETDNKKLSNDSPTILSFKKKGSSTVRAILKYKTTEEAAGWSGNYLPFMGFTNSYKAFFNFTEIPANRPINEVSEDFDTFLNIASPFISSTAQFEKWYFGPSSGLMNGLYSEPFEYDSTLDTSYNIPFGDELRYPKVLRWKFKNDHEFALKRGTNIAKGTKYNPGHILNRGIMLTAPLRCSFADPVGKIVNPSTGAITFVFSGDTTGQSNPNYVPYLGKAEIIYDFLNDYDFSTNLFTEYYTATAPALLYPSTVQALVTQDDFLNPAIMKFYGRAFHTQVETETLISESALQAASTISAAVAAGQYDQITAASTSGSAASITSTKVSMTGTKIPYTAENIIAYLEQFFGMFKSGIVEDEKVLELNTYVETDPALYRTQLKYAGYQQVVGQEIDFDYQDKNGKVYEESGKGHKKIASASIEPVYGESEELQWLEDKTLQDVIDNPEKCILLSFMHQYIGDYHEQGTAPDLYNTNTDANGNVYRTIADSVAPVYQNSAISTSDIKTGSASYGLQCSLRVFTPMDAFMPSFQAITDNPELVLENTSSSLSPLSQLVKGFADNYSKFSVHPDDYTKNYINYDRFLVYPAPSTAFPESLFLFTKQPLNLHKPAGSTETNKRYLISLYNAKEKKNLIYQIADKWDFDYDEYCKYVCFTTKQTESLALVRKTRYFEIKEQLAGLDEKVYQARNHLKSYPEYDKMTVERQTQVGWEDDPEEDYSTDRYYIYTYKFANLTSPTTNTSLRYEFAGKVGSTGSMLDNNLECLFKICQMIEGKSAGYNIQSLKPQTVQKVFTNSTILAKLDPDDLPEIDPEAETIEYMGLTLTKAFCEFLLNIVNWAIAKEDYEQKKKTLDELEAALEEETQSNILTKSFHCYHLAPVSLDLAKILESTQINLYAQELTSIDQSIPLDLSELNGKLQFSPFALPSESYFNISPIQAQEGIYLRTGISSETIKAELNTLQNSTLYLYAPKVDSTHSLASYENTGNTPFKLISEYFSKSLVNANVGIKRTLSRLTTDILKSFQLSVVQDSTSNSVPISLLELPNILESFMALESPILFASGYDIPIPIAQEEMASFPADSQPTLQSLGKLAQRYDSDFYYTATPWRLALHTNLEPSTWDALQIKPSTGTELTYQKYAGFIGFTHLTTEEYNVWTQLINGQSLVDGAYTVNLVNFLGDIEEESVAIAAAEEAGSLPEETIAALKEALAVKTSLFNKFFHMVFKTYIQAVFAPDTAASTEKILPSFKNLYSLFGKSLTDAKTGGFSAELCRKLDEYFGDGARPFFNLESRSCSLAVDDQILGLKVNYLNQLSDYAFQEINSLQVKVAESHSAGIIEGLEQFWDICFGSTDKGRYRLGSYLFDTTKNNFYLKINYPAFRYSSYEAYRIAKHFTANSSAEALFNSVKEAILNLRIQDSYNSSRLDETCLPKNLSVDDFFYYIDGLENARWISLTEEQEAFNEKIYGKHKNSLIVAWTKLASAIEAKIESIYNALVGIYFRDVNLLSRTEIGDYFGGESFKDNPGQVTFFEKETYTGNNRLTYYSYNSSTQTYTKVDNPVQNQVYYVPKWGFYNDKTGINNYYYIPQYCASEDPTSRIISPRYTTENLHKKIFNVENNVYQTTVNFNIPNMIYDAKAKQYKLTMPTLVSDIQGSQIIPDIMDDSRATNPWTEALTTDSSAVYQALLPVPSGSFTDASEAVLLGLVELVKQALNGSGSDNVVAGTPVSLTEYDSEPTGDPTGLYYKRFQALNTRMNRVTGPLYSAARYLKNAEMLQTLTKTKTQTVQAYEDLMTVVPVAKMAEMTYLPTQEAIGSEIPLDGKFYYNAEMDALREEISDKCVLTCTSCSVKDNCPFYNEEEILKLYINPVLYLDLYFKDNELDLLYYDKENYSPDIYEVKTEIQSGQPVDVKVGESISHEVFQAIHKPYSDILLKKTGDAYETIADIRLIHGKKDNAEYYVLPSLETEFKDSPMMSWNEKRDGDLSWLTGARYGTVEVNNKKNILQRNNPQLDIRDYTYMYNALYILDEETEFDYKASDEFYHIDDFYKFDKAGNAHRFTGQTKIKVPTSLKALNDADDTDDVYLISDDLTDTAGNKISPIIYLDTVGHLRQPGRTTFDLNLTSTVGVTQEGDRAEYAQDIANWCVRYCKGSNSMMPGDNLKSRQSHYSLADDRDQYWMENIYKTVMTDTKGNGKLEEAIISVPGRPRMSAGYSEPLINPDQPDEGAIISGKPVVAPYINFIRRFSIQLCEQDAVTKHVTWKIKWIKGTSDGISEEEKQQIEEKRRILPLMKTNLRLVIVKNN